MINAERVARDVIVIGGSAGAFPVMKGLLEVLPGSLPAAIGLVIHRSPYFESRLPSLLGSRSRLAVLEPRDGDPVRHGAVLLAPRDQQAERSEHESVVHDVARDCLNRSVSRLQPSRRS